jgi:hypothetical protein
LAQNLILPGTLVLVNKKGLPVWKLAYSFSVYIILPEITHQYLFAENICLTFLDQKMPSPPKKKQKKTNQNSFYKIATNLTHLFGFAFHPSMCFS